MHLDRFHPFVDLQGVSLLPLGLSYSALERQHALRAVELAEVEGLAILGGDVIHREDGRLRFANANWHCDRIPNEDQKAYVHRSAFEAQAYMRAYLPTLKGVLFTIVVDG